MATSRSRLVILLAGFVLLAALAAMYLGSAGPESPAPAPAAPPEETRVEPSPPGPPETIENQHEPPPASEAGNGESPAKAPGVPISGVVTDAAGSPLPGATVSVAGGKGGVTAPDGTFTVHPTVAGPVTLSVHESAHLPKQVEVRAPASGITVVLEDGFSVAGRVSFPDGRPVPGATIQGTGFVGTVTDEEGRYVLTGLPEGEVTVHCLPAWDKRRVRAGAANVDFTVKTHVVRVSFVDEEGRPLGGLGYSARATVDGEEVMTAAGDVDDDGTVECRAPCGTILVVAPSAPDRAPAVTSLVLDDHPRVHEMRVVVPRLDASGRISLRVARDTGEVPGTVFVSLLDRAGNPIGEEGEREIRLDAEGRAVLDAPPGPVTVSVGTAREWFVSEEDYGLQAKREITVESGRETPVEIVIETGGRVRVTVRNAAGDLLVPERLRVLDEAGEPLRVGFWGRTEKGWTLPPSDPGPAWLRTALPPGNYTIALYRDQKVVARREIAVVRARTLDVELRLDE